MKRVVAGLMLVGAICAASEQKECGVNICKVGKDRLDRYYCICRGRVGRAKNQCCIDYNTPEKYDAYVPKKSSWKKKAKKDSPLKKLYTGGAE